MRVERNVKFLVRKNLVAACGTRFHRTSTRSSSTCHLHLSRSSSR